MKSNMKELITIPTINGSVFLLSTLTLAQTYTMAQILLVLCTVAFTLYKLYGMWLDRKHKEKIYEIMKRAQSKCDKAGNHDCPMLEEYKQFESKGE